MNNVGTAIAIGGGLVVVGGVVYFVTKNPPARAKSAAGPGGQPTPGQNVQSVASAATSVFTFGNSLVNALSHSSGGAPHTVPGPSIGSGAGGTSSTDETPDSDVDMMEEPEDVSDWG